ncbi:MAG TPA: DUF4129 domain-containing protein [Pirellulaceae bacterium]|jgi:hypothetical protein|nr:DUF4129 domain-containing protein [Pirellulaceae bacterium]
MTRRLPTTLTDYVFWLINPALIMLLLDSFAFYLLEAHYDGEHKLRLLWAFAFYNMGIVACARIALIEGASAAEYLAIPLIAATMAVVGMLSGSPFAFLLIFVMAFLAFRLAKNTTILDDRDEASAMGLVGRIFAGTTKKQREAKARKTGGAADSGSDPATASAQATIEAENEGPATPWSRLMARIRGKRVDETPGLSILYATPFTLLTMGLSSWFLPPESRTYAHLLLALHLGCALTLLATATFLNLRRYLRQRMIQMPERMSGVWVASATLMLVGVLLAAMILPRPGLVEPLRSELYAAGSDWLNPSDWAMPWEGTKGEADSKSSGGEDDPEELEAQGEQDPKGSATGNASGDREPAEDGEGGAPGGTDAGQQGEGSGEPGSQSGSSGSTSEGGESGGESNGQQSDSENPDAATGSQPDAEASENGSSGEPAASSEASPSEPSPEGQAAAPPAEKGDPVSEALRQYAEAKQEQQDRFLRTVTWEKFFSTLRWILMFLIWIAAFLGAAYLIWRFREMIFAGLAQWWQQLREWFARTLRWGDPTALAAGASGAVAAAPVRPFSAYVDPFRSGAAARWNLRDLLAYSLEALDAWSRERQFPRGQGETPGEFASRLALREPATHATVVPFANVYAQAAFAPDGPPQNTIEVVRGLWHYLAMSTGNFGGPAGPASSGATAGMRPTAAPPQLPRQ